MSEQEAPSTPQIEQREPSAQPSQTSIILAELQKEIDAGYDLTDQDIKISRCHEIEKRTGIIYDNISKQVKKALRIHYKNTATGPTSVKRNLGSATVEVQTPAPIPQEPEPQEQQSAAPIQPAQPEKPRFNSQEELLASKEFKTVRMQLDMVFLGIDQVYGFLGINMLAAKQDPQLKAMFDAQMDGIAAYCVEEGIQMPKWAALLVIASGIGGIYVPPLLQKFGIVDFTGQKKKKDDKKTDEPLAPTKPM